MLDDPAKGVTPGDQSVLTELILARIYYNENRKVLEHICQIYNTNLGLKQASLDSKPGQHQRTSGRKLGKVKKAFRL